ncbi:radical SAM protein [Solirubrobacter sp. CPCC 204708]|uniref:Radical SAM protein n=1 Tax=Solirubrobacter deserti TaxID=2282478 RepID=A0ABT4RG69_9ACTN|nr:radical SAM protein [Solirubrobacter deserti]MBE2319733.1 radical SAM protein [Solirubrobacter deserti]MDA0137527.1 radical SAM protein [Solirubrobacter deserti]
MEAPPPPQHLQIEVTGACNLRCRMCLVRYAPAVSRRAGALSFEDYVALVDALPDLRRLTLQGLGEPLLSPHLRDMIRHAARRGVHVGFNTNGVLLTSVVAEELVEAGTGHVHVSLDGASAVTYEDVRHGTGFAPRPGQFEQVVRNLRGLIAARGKREAPRVVLVFVAMRRNVGELCALVELAADIGVDELWVQNLSHVFSDTDAAGSYEGIRSYAESEALFADATTAASARRVFGAAAERAEAAGLKLRLPQLSDPGGGQCTWPWDGAYVTHRGAVQPCCMVMGSDRATLGRLSDASFAEIWHGEPYRAFRRALASSDPPDVCVGCSQYRGVF